MSWGFVAIAGATIVSGAVTADAQGDAADDAARAQGRSSQAGIAEQQRQFDEIRQLLAPYAEGGEQAMQAQRALLGLAGPEEQQTSISRLQNSPQFTSMVAQGEDALLQNASATGGLRGGNTQAALAQFRPQMLNNLIQQQYQNLGGLTSIGQNAAALTGNAGMNSANQITGLFQQQGAAQAGAALAKGQARADFVNDMSGLAGLYIGGKF